MCRRPPNLPPVQSRRKFVMVTMMRCLSCQDLPGLKPAKARVKRKIQKRLPECSGSLRSFQPALARARDAQEARLKEIEEDRRRRGRG